MPRSWERVPVVEERADQRGEAGTKFSRRVRGLPVEVVSWVLRTFEDLSSVVVDKRWSWEEEVRRERGEGRWGRRRGVESSARELLEYDDLISSKCRFMLSVERPDRGGGPAGEESSKSSERDDREREGRPSISRRASSSEEDEEDDDDEEERTEEGNEDIVQRRGSSAAEKRREFQGRGSGRTTKSGSGCSPEGF